MTEIMLPKIREDIAYKIIGKEPKDIILFDPEGYTDAELQLPIEILPVLQMLNGSISLREFENILQSQFGMDYDVEPLYNLFKYLDHLGFMDSEKFRQLKEELNSYLESLVRPPVCAGNTYSADPVELAEEIENLMSMFDEAQVSKGARAVMVPHIDFRIGGDALASYAAAYHSIKDTDADIYVIFGTSHYGNSDNFMFSAKDFKTPIGDVKTDRKILDMIKDSLNSEMVIDELAHKNEHSIELQVVILKHILKDKSFKILPVLNGSFFKYLMNRQKPSDDEKFIKIINALNDVLKKEGRKPVFIASGDLAHIGRKFGDPFDAEPELPKLMIEDEELIKSLERCDADGFFDLIAAVNDRRKVCGLSPFYALLKAFPAKRGKFYKYGQWNEIEQASAVSFAGISFYD